MKRRIGINQDFADFDEIDQDAIGAEGAYRAGQLTFDELAALVGLDEAKELQDKRFGPEEVIPDVDTFDELHDWLGEDEPF